MIGEHTESAVSEGPSTSRIDWTLIVAMDCQALAERPRTVGLTGVSEVAIGRGPARQLLVQGSRLRLDFPDRWMSRQHALLIRAGDRWSIEDSSSRNGCRVNGEPVERKLLRDGDVVACGGTYFVLRLAAPVDVDSMMEQPEALRTLCAKLASELRVLPLVARSTVPVLVLGESGTGKEGIARAVHTISGRDGPLTAVNCGAIPGTLIESELFGSRRGAFSGAEDRPGLLRSTARGTLFLDEVAELPLASQAALLRVLQEKELIPLGGDRAIPLDVRVVAATNRPVARFIAEGKLRLDLYARLSSYEIGLPPLRERREDLGLLVATLIARHDRTGAVRTLSRGASASLFAYEWPLNIRELEQAISAALAVSEHEIGVEHLPAPVRETEEPLRAAATSQRQRLVLLLRKHRGNVSAVARDLETSRSHVHRLIKRHAIRPEDVIPLL